jgi:hypothetical protein
MLRPIMKLAVIALSVLALFVAGCGGSGSDEETLTKAEFIKQADALCKKVDEREFGEYGAWSKANEKQLNGLSPNEVGAKAIAAIVVPSVRKEMEEIKALGIPEGDEETLEKYFEAGEKGVKGTEKNPISANAARPENPFWESFKLGSAYGFKECDELY